MHESPGERTVASLLRSIPTPPSEAWRTAASTLLRASRRECDSVVALFEEGADERRTLILDLLADAGTPVAQAAMRRILALPSACGDMRVLAAYVPKLARLERPDADTLAFLGTLYAKGKTEAHEIRAACAYALGIAIGRASDSGNADGALRASEALRRDLLASLDTLAICALLTALSRAGLPGDAAIFIRYARHADPVVRASAALSLRKRFPKPEVRAHLLTLAADPAVRVAQSALVALSDHDLSEDDRARLAALVLAGRTPLALDGRIRAILTAKGESRHPAIEDALRLLLSRATDPAASTSGERRISSDRSPPVSENSRVTIPTPFPRGHAAPLPFSGQYRLGATQLERLG